MRPRRAVCGAAAEHADERRRGTDRDQAGAAVALAGDAGRRRGAEPGGVVLEQVAAGDAAAARSLGIDARPHRLELTAFGPTRRLLAEARELDRGARREGKRAQPHRDRRHRRPPELERRRHHQHCHVVGPDPGRPRVAGMHGEGGHAARLLEVGGTRPRDVRHPGEDAQLPGPGQPASLGVEAVGGGHDVRGIDDRAGAGEGAGRVKMLTQMN